MAVCSHKRGGLSRTKNDKVVKQMKVLNFGSLNIDYVYSLDHFVQKGETISSERLDIFSGGKGLNQSVALGRAGAEVSD